MARGIPVCPQLIVGVLPRPPSARLAMAASSFARYSGTRGACCPALGGLLGSHRLVLRSVHRPDQSGYFHCANAGTLALQITAAKAIARIEIRGFMTLPPTAAAGMVATAMCEPFTAISVLARPAATTGREAAFNLPRVC